MSAAIDLPALRAMVVVGHLVFCSGQCLNVASSTPVSVRASLCLFSCTQIDAQMVECRIARSVRSAAARGGSTTARRDSRLNDLTS